MLAKGKTIVIRNEASIENLNDDNDLLVTKQRYQVDRILQGIQNQVILDNVMHIQEMLKLANYIKS